MSLFPIEEVSTELIVDRYTQPLYDRINNSVGKLMASLYVNLRDVRKNKELYRELRRHSVDDCLLWGRVMFIPGKHIEINLFLTREGKEESFIEMDPSRKCISIGLGLFYQDDHIIDDVKFYYSKIAHEIHHLSQYISIAYKSLRMYHRDSSYRPSDDELFNTMLIINRRKLSATKGNYIKLSDRVFSDKKISFLNRMKYMDSNSEKGAIAREILEDIERLKYSREQKDGFVDEIASHFGRNNHNWAHRNRPSEYNLWDLVYILSKKSSRLADLMKFLQEEVRLYKVDYRETKSWANIKDIMEAVVILYNKLNRGK